MKNAILIHGTCDQTEYFNASYPSLSNSHWFPWLQKRLLIAGIPTQTPEMFQAYTPDYQLWKRELERFEIGEETILVGHSCGGGFLLRWLSENDKRIDKLLLVAPWLDPRRSTTRDFFDFKIDAGLMKRINQIHLFVSWDDDADVLVSVKTIHDTLPKITMHDFKTHGHFTFGVMKTVEFPELLESIE